jgi:hypothetical protein
MHYKHTQLGSKGVGGKGGDGEKGGVMTQSLYAHLNKGNKKIHTELRNA